MRQGVRTWICAALALALAGGPAFAETLADRVDRMERELKELKAELRRRDAADRKRETGRAAAAKTAPAPAAPAVAASPASTTEVAAAEPTSTRDRALDAIIDRVRLGGYGSVRFEGSSLDDQPDTFTYRRFVLTADADIAPRLRAYMELEFERFTHLELEKTTTTNADGGITQEQAVEGSNGSEISLEQAWLQFDLDDMLKLRAGNVLVPVGRFNINHDDNRWDIPRRSLVDRGTPVLPAEAAWSELGVGFLGDIPMGDQGVLNYQGYVVNGVTLDTEFETILQSRQGDTTKNEIEAKVSPTSGTFSQDVKNAKSITGRLAYTPALGHEIGMSGYWGRYTPDFLPDEDLWSASVDGLTGWGPFELEGEYVYTRFEGIQNVARGLARRAIQQESESEAGDVETEVEFELAGLARAKQGYWLEGRYRFWPAFLSDTFLGR
ncbi:MAG TPA: hypothetical protein VMS22_12240, partial [Candidatus Eisenbacteria bacterium]|nr:hypothetical protein [Candidatus Eisenbacteria bacterium]